jgi:hypothetical protein
MRTTKNLNGVYYSSVNVKFPLNIFKFGKFNLNKYGGYSYVPNNSGDVGGFTKHFVKYSGASEYTIFKNSQNYTEMVKYIDSERTGPDQTTFIDNLVCLKNKHGTLLDGGYGIFGYGYFHDLTQYLAHSMNSVNSEKFSKIVLNSCTK